MTGLDRESAKTAVSSSLGVAAALAAATALVALLELGLELQNTSSVYLLAVVAVAIWRGTLWEFDDAYRRLVEAVRTAPEPECAPDGWAYRYAERTARSHYPEHLLAASADAFLAMRLRRWVESYC